MNYVDFPWILRIRTRGAGTADSTCLDAINGIECSICLLS